MEEFEPKRKIKILTKEFISKNIYVLVLAVLLLGGITYGYTFFKENKKVASGSITTAALTINMSNGDISATNLSVPQDNQEGLSEFSKSLTITNTTATDGVVNLTLTRTSGLNLTDMSYAIVVNGAIQEIGDVPSDGEILTTAIMGNETANVEVRLWPKTSYSGSTTTFVGEVTPEIKYLGPVASSLDNPAGKYVNFNCNAGTCEKWQIVKVEDDRLVLTRQSDYTNATSRTNSERYDSTLTFNDNSLITSVSTDGKNVYLAKTVKITGGDGTVDNPYTLENNIYNEEDKKVVAVITYKDGTTTLGTQNVYYNETNYISQILNNPAFQYWDDGVDHYNLGDIINLTTDTNLIAVTKLNSTLTLTNNTVSLTYGTNGENSYTFNGDGTLSCTSSDTTKVTCNVNTTTNKIELTPVGVTTANVTIDVSALEGTNYFAPTPQSFTVSVAKGESSITCNTPQNWTGSSMQSYTTYSGCTPSTNTSVSDANTYAVTCTGDANHNDSTCSFTINKVAASITCNSAQTYTGSAITSYSSATGCASIDNNAPTNAGTYTVKCNQDGNHNTSPTCSFTINKKATTMSISPASGTITFGSSTTTTITTDGDGTKSCSSSNTGVATCSVSGNTVTINGVAAGSATITVSQAAGTNYNAATSKTYSVTVNCPLAATYIKNNVSGLENVAGAYRYIGATPNNYVWFNNEQWRIIGVYGDQLKIIRATPSTTTQKWQNAISDGNVWSGSLMQSTYLYNTYWPTLNSTAQGMVNQSATWNVGACSGDIAAADAYTCAQATTWTGKIGLIASYEFLYAAESSCWTTDGFTYMDGCYQKDWLFSTVTNSGSSLAWALSTYSDNSRSALLVNSLGCVSFSNVNNSNAASPVVYLKSTVTITGGNGGSGQTNSYKLG